MSACTRGRYGTPSRCIWRLSAGIAAGSQGHPPSGNPLTTGAVPSAGANFSGTDPRRLESCGVAAPNNLPRASQNGRVMVSPILHGPGDLQ